MASFEVNQSPWNNVLSGVYIQRIFTWMH